MRPRICRHIKIWQSKVNSRRYRNSLIIYLGVYFRQACKQFVELKSNGGPNTDFVTKLI